MINLFKKGMQIFSKKAAQCEQLDVNAENEYQAMCCGALNPRFLAKIKKSKADYNKNKNKKSNN